MSMPISDRDPTSKRKYPDAYLLPILSPTACIRIRLRIPTHSRTTCTSTSTRRPRACRRWFPSCRTRAQVQQFAARSLWFSRLLKRFCCTSYCFGLAALPRIGDVSAPARLPWPNLGLAGAAPVLLLSISASARSIVGSEKDDEPKGLTKPVAGGADPSVVGRKSPRESRSALRAVTSQERLIRASDG